MKKQITFATAIAALTLAACAALPNPKMPAKPTPEVACTLSPEQLRKQRQQLLPGLFKRADKVEDISKGADGLRLHFTQRPGLLAELARIIESEQACCSFLHFQLTVEASAGPVTFDVTGPAGTREMLKAL